MTIKSSYKGREIVIEPDQFANGWAITVHVDGTEVLDKYDASALFGSEAEAISAGEAIARRFIDHHL